MSKSINFMNFVFKRSRTYPNRYLCVEIHTTIVIHGDRWTAYRPGSVSGETEWFRNAVGAIRTFETAEKCIKAVVKQWEL